MEPGTQEAKKELSDSTSKPWWQRLFGRKPPHPSSVTDEVETTPEKYMEIRAVHKIENYEKAAKKQRWWYRTTSIVTIICSASVPVLINLGRSNRFPDIDFVLLTTSLSLLVTILVSAEKLFRFREHWKSYDAVAAALHYEQLQFQAKAGKYKEEVDSEKQDRFQRFVLHFEKLIMQEKRDRNEMATRGDGSLRG